LLCGREGLVVSGVDDATVGASNEANGSTRLALLLAMAMFVLVVDTSLMNVSISKVVHDLGTTVSAVQSAIALEALISASFILINSKVGDLIGRKRAYVLGLLGYAVGALAMTLAQSITAVVIFWAIIGGLGASLLLPAMQSLIHGNFEGAAQKKTYALVGAAAAIAAAVGPLLGGFLTTYLSWRVGFLLELIVIAVVLSQIRLVKDIPYTGDRQVDVVGSVLSVLGMGGVVLGILVWQEGGDYVVLLIALGSVALLAFARWLVRRHREGKVTVLDPDLFRLPNFRLGISGQTMQNVTLGGAMIALPIFLQIKLEYTAMQTGLSLTPLSLTMFAAALLAGKSRKHRQSASVIRIGFALSTVGMALLIPIVPRATSGWYLVAPLMIAGAGLGLLVSQLNNYTLAPIDEERVSEAAGVNSAAGSFGLSFGLAMAGGILLATLSLAFTNMVNSSSVIPSSQKQQISHTMEHDAEVVSNTQLERIVAQDPPAVQAEILKINTHATNIALQVALLIPILAGLLGLFNSFRMMRLPETEPSTAVEGAALG
jgi:EmrB/QacA subfamily drug resistance transporter